MTASPRPVTLVTGGGRGIGAAIARRLAAEGHDLVLNYRARAQEAEATAAACRAAGASVHMVQADLADLTQAARLVPAAIAEFGQLDHLINNAGVTGRVGPFEQVDLEHTEFMFRLNAFAPILLSQHLVGHLRESGRPGSIVNISSIVAGNGAPNRYIPYAMSKAALNTLTVGLSKEAGPDGIRVNTVTPGTIRTEIHADACVPDAPEERAKDFPLQRAGEPEEVAAAVAYLVSEDAAYVTGTEIRVTGGG
jgi:NAD(P)-dependent dehydrogenase (short-subunit alcohol dehydrogenase family)